MNELETKMDALRKEYIDTTNQPIRAVYVDLEMISDLRLGAMFSTFTVKEQMEYVYSRLPEYNSRYDLETASHFPVLKMTDGTLDKMVIDNPLKACSVAPWTSVFEKLTTILSMAEANNKSLADGSVIRIVINCELVDYPDDLKKKLQRFFQTNHPAFQVSFTHTSRYSQGAAYFLQFDMMFLYDYKTFLSNEEIMKSFTSKFNYMGKTLYVLPLVDASTGLDKSEYLKALVSTRSFLNLYTDLHYMPGSIPVDA